MRPRSSFDLRGLLPWLGLLLRLLLWLGRLLRLRLLLTLGRKMMPDGAACRRAQDRVMTGDVAGDGTDGGTLDAAFGIGRDRCSQEHRTHQRCGEHVLDRIRMHEVTPVVTIGSRAGNTPKRTERFHRTAKASSTLPAVAPLPTA